MDVCIPKGTLPKRQNLPWLSKPERAKSHEKTESPLQAGTNLKTVAVTHMKNYKALRNKRL